jgi:hypothetical protein
MSKSYLANYLNDHLAGSVVALEMMEHLEKPHAGSNVAHQIADLRADVLADRAELERLMSTLSIPTSPTRKAMAWLSDKTGEIKLRMDDRTDGPLCLLEAVEAIAIGIHGKEGLWRALCAARVEGITAVDLASLQRRASEQRERIETLRLDAARFALQAAD